LQVYKSSSKRKSHILKNHPGAALPAGAREVNMGKAEADASTFSHTVCLLLARNATKWCMSGGECDHPATQL
jgi:hypothetical protein